MANLKLNYKRLPAKKEKYGEGFTLNSLSKVDYAKFNHTILGLGDLSKDGKYINALSAFVDLQGFTDFCNQVDSNLVIPEYLTKYLTWLFNEIAMKFKEGDYEDHIKIWGKLPFYAKFLGDGVLFIWETDDCGGLSGLMNIIGIMFKITKSYETEFLPFIEKSVVKPPKILRCGISRGQIISLGNGEDFVGSCINMAARLQRISKLSFAISRRGFDIEKHKAHFLNEILILKKYPIRGIGTDELIYILKDEFNDLPKEEKLLFID